METTSPKAMFGIVLAAGLSIFLVLSAMMSVSLYMGRSDALEMSQKMGETVSGFARDASIQLLSVQRQVAFYTKKNRLLVQAVLSVGAIAEEYHCPLPAVAVSCTEKSSNTNVWYD
ncbi:MAG: hypothetical protein J6N99_05145 [Schwartzia sp.]|nr:hypothetical protein [Schwartzia sp. (in: firmicutes)]